MTSVPSKHGSFPLRIEVNLLNYYTTEYSKSIFHNNIEKALVMNMIKAAIASKEDYYQQQDGPAPFVPEEKPKTPMDVMPEETTIGVNDNIDRWVSGFLFFVNVKVFIF